MPHSALQGRTSRRRALAAGGAAGLAAAMLPHLAMAEPKEVEAEIKKLYGDKKIGTGKITIDAPAIAENGNVVPLNIAVESPMTEQDHVKAVHVFADGNPLPYLVTYWFAPVNGKAAASTRIRLAKTQNVVAVAEMSNGALHMAKAEVKVTIGGCGG